MYIICNARYREPERREGRLCVLMELCDGGCVASILRLYGPLRWNLVARCLHACARTCTHPSIHPSM